MDSMIRMSSRLNSSSRMRFKKGSKVEVLRTNEVSSGSWYCAEIIHGNGHYYTVRYEHPFGSSGEARFERVPRKAIRPCLPTMQISEDWTSGDVIEVFHQFSWNMAIVLSSLSINSLLVRLLESSHEIKVSTSDVRPRLCWQDDEWKVIDKASHICDERQDGPSTLKYNHSSKLAGTRASIGLKDSCFPSGNFNSIHNSQAIPSRSLKRKLSYCYSQIEEHAVPCQKVRKDSRRRPFISSCRFSLPEKVVAAASSRKMLVEKSILPSPNRLLGFSETTFDREKMDGVVRCSFGVSLESGYMGSITSSVASCSASWNNACEIPQGFPREDNDEYNSDAESICRLGSEEGNCLVPVDEKLAEEIHRLELQAYHSIMEALYVAGPLSWEQEALLTNLRNSLHISNDEHLMELRKLISSRTCIPNS